MTLYEAINQLTQPHDVEISDAGRVLGTRTDPPLLDVLCSAIANDIAPAGYGGSSAQLHDRHPFDPVAHRHYVNIETRIRAWARDAGYRPIHKWPTATTLLRLWVNMASQRALDAAAPTLDGWVNIITDLLIDPPDRFDINAPCPLCHHARTSYNRDGITVHGHTLTATQRTPAHKSTIECRYCGALWEGINGAERLAEQLAQQPEFEEQHA